MDPSRRRLIKAGTASVGAAVVWAEPTIRGLARRPAYARATSGPPITQEITLTGERTFGPRTLILDPNQNGTIDGLPYDFEVLAATVFRITDATPSNITFTDVIDDPQGVTNPVPFTEQGRRLRFVVADCVAGGGCDQEAGPFSVTVELTCVF